MTVWPSQHVLLAIRRQAVLRDSSRVRAKFFLARENLPANAHHLVRQRDDRHLTLSTRLDLAQPSAERRLVAFQIYERGLGALDEELAQVRVSALADRSERRLPARGVLARDQSEPGGHVATASEHAAVTDRGDHGRGDHRTNARNRRGAATQRRSLGPLGQVPRGLGNLDVEREPALPEPMDEQGEAG